MKGARFPTAETLQRLIAVVGQNNAITDATEMEPYLKEWRERWDKLNSLGGPPGRKRPRVR